MRKISKFGIAAFTAMSLMALTACGDSSKSSNAPTLAAPATGTEYKGKGYTITAPEAWQDCTSSAGSSQVDLAVGDTEGAGSSAFTENINIIVQPVGSGADNYSIDQYINSVKEQYSKQSGFNVTNTSKCTINGKEAGIVEVDAQSGSTKYKCKQVFVIDGSNSYIMTYSGDTEGGYDGDLAEADSIMASFKLSK